MLVDKLQSGLEQLETGVVAIAGRIGPMLAPVPTAFLVGRASEKHLGWPEPIALIAAVVVECLGLASTGLALDLYAYNRGKRKSDPVAPFKLSVVIVAAYFVIALVLTVALDIVPEMAPYAPAIFPALSLTGVAILAIRVDQRERVRVIEEEKAQKKQERQEKKQATFDATVTRQELVDVTVTPMWRDKSHFLGDSDKPDGLTPRQLSDMAQVSLRTAQRWLETARSSNGKVSS